MEYDYYYRQDENGQITVTFPEIPEMGLATFKTVKQMEDEISGAFCSAIEQMYKRKGVAIPLPKEHEDADCSLVVDSITQAKIFLWNWLVKHYMTPAVLAKKSGYTRQEVHRVLDFTQNTTMKKLEELLAVIGYAPDLKFVKCYEDGDE